MTLKFTGIEPDYHRHPRPERHTVDGCRQISGARQGQVSKVAQGHQHRCSGLTTSSSVAAARPQALIAEKGRKGKREEEEAILPAPEQMQPAAELEAKRSRRSARELAEPSKAKALLIVPFPPERWLCALCSAELTVSVVSVFALQ
jgi:hypothetical protein